MKPNCSLFNSVLLTLVVAPIAIAEPGLPDASSHSSSIPYLRDLPRPHTDATLLTQEPPPPEPLPTENQLDDSFDDVEEEEITITGTRTPRPTRLSPASITVIDDEEIDEFLIRDLRDLFRYEPNVSVGNDRRYGLQDINIRGLGGNRVLILNDGIRIPTQFQFGTPSLGRDYVDIESLQRVEVIRGPASALYGSDALERGGQF